MARGWPAGVPKRAWTAKRFGAVIGISETQMVRFLEGTYYPTVQLMKKIEEVLDWPVGDQITLVPKEGTDMIYGMALKEALDHKFREKFEPRAPGDAHRRAHQQRGQGWSGTLVAKRIGVETSTAWRYLDGARYPTLAVMRTIEKVYDWPLGDQLDLIPPHGRNTEYGEALVKAISKKEGKRYGTPIESLDT